MLRLILLFLPVCVLVPGLATASIPGLAVRCDGCNDAEQRARALATNPARPLDVYVMSIADGASSISGFRVYSGSRPNNLPVSEQQISVQEATNRVSAGDGAAVSTSVWAEPLDVPPHVHSGFMAYAAAYQAFVNITRNDVYLDDGPYTTVSDIASCQACGRDWVASNIGKVADHLHISDSLRAAGVQFEISIGGRLAGGMTPRTAFGVHMAADVGRSTGYCMGSLEGNQLSVDVYRCVDSDGNRIPASPDGYRYQSFSFATQADFDEFLRRAKTWGVPINPSGAKVVTGEIRIDCGEGACNIREPH